jgi:hypothetical protein
MVNSVVADAHYNDSNTTAKIQILVDVNAIAIAKIADYAEDSSNDKPTLIDYQNAAIANVDEGNLALVNDVIQAANRSEADTFLEIQALVDSAATLYATALNKIKDWDGEANTDDSNIPSESDYQTISVTGVNADNLEMVNLVIADSLPENSDSAIKIQNLVSIKTPAIEKIANWGEVDNALSQPTTQDYIDADVDITDVHLDIINLIMLEIGFNESDTTAEIQTLVSVRAAAITLIANYADSNGSTTQPTQQTYIDAQVVNIDTLSYVSLANAAVQAATIDEVNTTAKIQILVDNAILVSSDALNKIANWTTLSPAEDEPTLADYTTAGVLNVDDNNLAIVNSVMSFIEFEQSNTLELIQTLVDTKAKSIELIADYANRNGDGSAPTALNYETAGVEITNADINIVDLVLTDTQILFEHADTTLEIQGLVSVNAAAIQLISTYTQDTSNPPSLIDYTNAGIINLDEIQVATVNIAVNATNDTAAVDTRLEIQILADSTTQLYTTSFAIINYWGEADNELDEPTIQDYANIGVFEVVDSNLNIVNIVISDATFDATDTPTKIQTLVSIKAIAISKISTYADNNTASPTVQDYIVVGVG